MRYRLLGYFLLAWMVSVPCLYAAYDSPSSTQRALQNQRGQQAQPFRSQQPQTQALSRTDQRLRSKIQSELQALPFSSREISFEVENGKVTLHGKVATSEQLEMVQERLENNVDGITIIDNQLEIEQIRPQQGQQRWNSRDYNRY